MLRALVSFLISAAWVLACPVGLEIGAHDAHIACAQDGDTYWTTLDGEEIDLDDLAGDLADDEDEDETELALRSHALVIVHESATPADPALALAAAASRITARPPESPPPASPIRPPNAA